MVMLKIYIEICGLIASISGFYGDFDFSGFTDVKNTGYRLI